MDDGRHGRFIGGLPERGIWTAVGLTRGQFFVILGVSIALFVFWGGPVWRAVRASHFDRITVSYAMIPAGVAAALHHNGELRLFRVVVASAVIALVKLVVTAGMLVAFALA